MSGLSFSVLGSTTVTLDGEPVRLGGPKERLVLAALLLNSGRVVSSERLVDVLWPDDPPERAHATMQVHVSNLRRRLAPGRPEIITQPPGYVVLATAHELDTLRLEELAALARDSAARGDVAAGIGHLEAAAVLWRGTPLADLEQTEFVVNARAFLDERRNALLEQRVDLLLAAARPTETLPLIAVGLELQPLRESLWEQQMVALYRCGRQADALAAYRACRERLIDELGVEPAPRLQAVERAVLGHDPCLDLTPPAATGTTGAPSLAQLAVTFVSERRPCVLRLDDGSVHALDDVVSIGRHPDSAVVLTDPAASRHHVEIRPALGGHLLTDLASSNGTKVAGVAVMHHLLEPGEVIEIGTHTLVYERG